MNVPGVHEIVEDGRSFVRNTPYRYDVIAMNVVDTLTAMSSGAYVLSETYLYTVDAFMDYISHLKPGGTMCVTRWDYSVEGPRLFSVALEALYRLKIPHPGKCILAFAAPYSTVCVRNTPFAPEEVGAAREQVRRYVESGQPDGPGRFMHPMADGEAHDEQQTIVHHTAKARAQGRQRAYFKSLPLRVDPVYDDNPFFFNYDKAPILALLSTENDAPDLIRGHWASLTLYVLLVLATVAVALFMFLPLLRSGRGSLPHFPLWLLYFACLGGAFIFVEIALMQRFALLLGHPSRSLALVLAALLFSAGVGSYASGRWSLSLPVVLGLLAAALLGVAFVYPFIISAIARAAPLDPRSRHRRPRRAARLPHGNAVPHRHPHRGDARQGQRAVDVGGQRRHERAGLGARHHRGDPQQLHRGPRRRGPRLRRRAAVVHRPRSRATRGLRAAIRTTGCTPDRARRSGPRRSSSRAGCTCRPRR